MFAPLPRLSRALRASALALAATLLLTPVLAGEPTVNPRATAAVDPGWRADVETVAGVDLLTRARQQRAAAVVEMHPTFLPRPTPTPTPTPAPSATPVPQPRAASTPTPAAGAIPACTYDDIATSRAGLDDWATTVVDTALMLPAGYAPTDLVDSSAAGLNGGYSLRSIIVDDLRAMAADAAAAGVPLRLVSGYRSYATQVSTFNHWVSVGGYEQALRTSARPGHSEHQLGTTVDVTGRHDAAPWEYADWATTPAGAWMAANAQRYGFVLSYPRGASATSCYDYEPWHYRYVGRPLARAIAGARAVPRVFLLTEYGP